MTHPRAHAAIGLVALVAACGAAQGGFGSVGAPGGGDGGAQSSGGSSGTSASSGGGSSGASSGGSSSSTAGASSSSGGSTSSSGSPPPPGPPGCGLAQAAFCDTFDTPSPGGRAGDLDDASWSASRISTINNFGQGQYNVWGSTTTSACGKQTSGVLPPNDMFFCAGGGTPSMHFNDGYDDDGGFTIHSYRIRQPFDFANRTGIIAFDVGAKDAIPGGHGFWFNVFVSEEPVPSPYQQGQATALFAKGGLGFEFENVCSGDQTSNTISNIFVEQNYAIVNQIAAPPIGTTPCFKTQEEVMNHVELHISQSHVEVFVSDAGNPQSLRSIMATDVSLNFTRGYVSLQHTHYNAQKCSFTTTTCQDCTNPQCPVLAPYTTYHWDNAGFDGPVLPKPRAYEVPDNNTPAPPSDFGVQTQIVSLSDGGTTSITSFPGPPINTGYQLGTDGLSANQRGIMATNGGAAAPVTLQGVDLTNAADAVLTMNAWDFCDPIQYRFNGGTWRTFSSPFPECDMGARAVAIPVQLSDLKSGDNTLEMYTNTGNGGVVGAIVANIELTVDVH